MSIVKVKQGGAAVMKRRLLQCTILVPALGLGLCSAATQVAAYRLGYDPQLGPALISHFYWPWRWWQWSHDGWAAYDPKTFEIAKGILLAGSTFLMACAMMAARRKPKEHSDVHGTARYATRKEIAKAGLLPEAGGTSKGLYLGALESRGGGIDYLRHDGAEHVLGIGPMRSGKSHGLAVPNLITHEGSLVCYDPKGELWDLTAGWRAREGGNTVMRLEFGAPAGSARYNFFDDVRLGTPYEYLDVASLMEAIADPAGKGMNDHWDPSAASLMVGVALHVLYAKKAKGERACLPDVLYALNDPDDQEDGLFKAMKDNKHLPGRRRHDTIAREGASQLNKAINERSGVRSTVVRMLRTLNDPVLAENLSSSDFTISELMNADRPVSLYFVVKEDQRLAHLPLVRLFLTRMTDRLLSADLQDGRTPHRWPLLLMMDEFASLKRMDSFVSALERCPGYGIRAMLLVQDRDLLVREYGENETVSGMCHIRVAYTPNGLKTAEWVSKNLGTATVNKEDISESGQRGRIGQLSTSRSYHQVSRSLLNADEVMRLRQAEKIGTKVVAPGEEAILIAGQYPIKALQSLWFFDPELERRVRFPKAQSQTLAAPVPVSVPTRVP